MLYNVTWGGGVAQEKTIFVLYNMCVAPNSLQRLK